VKLSTRLLLPLLATVVLVMLLYGSWALRQRQAALVADAARETRAFTLALALSVERALQRPQFGGVQEIVDRVSREPTIYGVLVYGRTGDIEFRSDDLREAEQVAAGVLTTALAGTGPVGLERTLSGETVYSVIMPLRGNGGEVLGALEVAQPLTFLQTDQATVRQRYLLNTLTLIVAVIVLVVLMVHRFISQPLERFTGAVRTLGRGELAYRMDVEAAGGELREVAEELNRMAAHLEAARSDLLRETEERVALERRLRQTERLAAMGELAAGVAHEIAAPLHVIRGRADLLSRQGVHPDGSRNLEIIAQQIDRITIIVKNLLSFARRREPRLVQANLVEIVEGVAEFLEDEIASVGVEVVWHRPAVLSLHCDPDLLHQVFLNLMLNALQALEAVEPGARCIHIRMARIDDRADVGPSARVEIRDTGPGIPFEVRGRVFDPFVTTKGGSQGTGLGLSVARGIVEDHGGRMDAGADGAAGAVFRVTLPLGNRMGSEPERGNG